MEYDPAARRSWWNAVGDRVRQFWRCPKGERFASLEAVSVTLLPTGSGAPQGPTPAGATHCPQARCPLEAWGKFARRPALRGIRIFGGRYPEGAGRCNRRNADYLPKNKLQEEFEHESKKQTALPWPWP